jgi:CRISPR-associated endonuclease Csy4
MSQDWLAALAEHVQIMDSQPVPASAHPYQLRRVQAKSSPARLRRRQIRRHGISAEQAQIQIPEQCIERLKLPFVAVASKSTGHRFNLYLQLAPSTDGVIPGSFNAYGLSASATTPWF